MMGMLVQRPKMEEDCSYCKRRGEEREPSFVFFPGQSNFSFSNKLLSRFNASEVQYFKK